MLLKFEMWYSNQSFKDKNVKARNLVVSDSSMRYGESFIEN